MSPSLKNDILTAVEESRRMTQHKKKSPKNKQYFIIKFPKGEEVLVKCKGWAGIIPFTNYLKDEFGDDTIIISIRRWEAYKYVLCGRVFKC